MISEQNRKLAIALSYEGNFPQNNFLKPFLGPLLKKTGLTLLNNLHNKTLSVAEL